MLFSMDLHYRCTRRKDDLSMPIMTEQDSQQDTTSTQPTEEKVVYQPDASLLMDRVPPHLQASRALAIWIVLLGIAYIILSYQAVYYTDIWGHLNYGNEILKTGHVPTQETTMPLAKGVPMVDTAWLSQVGAAFLYQNFGLSSLQFLYAAPITMCLVILAYMVYCRTQSHVMVIVALTIFALVDGRFLTLVRPQLAGLLCFVALMPLLFQKWHVWNWALVPAVFCLWVNLHGSWPMGIAMLGCLFLGRCIDKCIRTEKLSGIYTDHLVIRYFLLLELSAIALLVNPYGLKTITEVLLFSHHPNLDALTEWDPLHLQMFQGQMAAIVCIGLLFVYRWTPRRVTSSETLLLMVFGLASMWSNRMLIWWAPIAAWFMIKHMYAIWMHRYPGMKLNWKPSPKNGRWSVVSVGLLWIFFAYTPFGTTLLHGQQKDPKKKAIAFRKNVDPGTPVLAVNYLKEHPPEGQVFNTYEWGDYLLFNGPKDCQIFVASHAHLIPVDVWNDYLQIISLRVGWEDKLDRYGVNTILVDKMMRAGLINRLNEDSHLWRKDYEDNIAIIYSRRQPIHSP